MGIAGADGSPKLLGRLLLDGGIEAVRRVDRLARPAGRRAPRGARRKPVLITGGAGFIGTNLADLLAGAGEPVLIYDTLERPGAERNLAWLQERHGERIRSEPADVRDPHAARAAAGAADTVFHFAAQVAVTTSMADPVADFEVNALGTLNMLEVLRARSDHPLLVYTSTNKVYGTLAGVPVRAVETRWQPRDGDLERSGIAEDWPVDFHSPYGCSKGAADQYVLDWARTYRLPTTVFRMSCIYGSHQHGTEDQGWVAHFLISTLTGRPVTLYGDGRQVRDALFVGDLVDAFLAARRAPDKVAGKVFNIGGGPANAISLIELIDRMSRLTGRHPALGFGEWCTGDQPWYVSDIGRIGCTLGSRPRISIDTGLACLRRWLTRAELPDTSDLQSRRKVAS